MKKIFYLVFAVLVFFRLDAYAFDSKLLDIRTKILDESKEIKGLLANTKDVILISSLWDACILTTNQLDAYFSMLGIFNTINKKDYSVDAVNYLIDWLNAIKGSNDLNLTSLNSMPQIIEASTKTEMVVLKNYFNELNNQIAVDLNKLSVLKKALKPNNKK